MARLESTDPRVGLGRAERAEIAELVAQWRAGSGGVLAELWDRYQVRA